MSQVSTLGPAIAIRSGDGGVWLHRYAMALVLLTFLLIVAGGNVTTLRAGLSVPDWPLSFHSVNPAGWTSDMGGTHPGVRDEHGHRLIGAAVGLMVIGLVIWLQLAEPRGWVRKLGFLALAGVIVQGIMGGLRVTEKSLALAIVHGCLAQAFFCLTLAMAAATSPQFPGGKPFGGADPARDRALRTWTAILVGAFFGQVVLGVLLRQLGGGTALVAHVCGALFAGACLVTVMLHALSRPESREPLSRLVTGLGVLFVVQFLLGMTAYLLLRAMAEGSIVAALQPIMPTVHVAVGALVLGVSFLTAFRAYALTSSMPLAASPAEGVPA